MNSGGVVTRKGHARQAGVLQPAVLSAVSVLDPTKTHLAAPADCHGLVDAFVHTMEQYLTYPVNGLAQDRFAEGLLQTLIELAPRAMQEVEPTTTTAPA